jgi:hypothetical protein
MKGLLPFASKRLGIKLYPGQRDVLKAAIASARHKWLLCLGRRAGKGLLTACAAIFDAVGEDYSGLLRPNETRFIVVVASRQEQAREFIRTVRELLAGAPDHDLASLVDTSASTQDEVIFKTGVVIRAMPCSSRSTRGLPISLLIFDEAAHFVSDTEGYAAFKSVWRALLPSVAQFKGRGHVIITSTPLFPSGWFYDLYRAGSTGSDSDMFVIRAPTWEVNPTITQESLSGEFAADPEGAAVEYAAEFLQSGGAYLDATNVMHCMVSGRRQLNPRPGVRYRAAIDPAFARGGDAFSLAIAHCEEEVVVLDALHSWRGRNSPLNSDHVLDEVADILRSYKVRSVISDQFSVQPITQALRRRSIEVKYQPLTALLKADIYSTLKRRINLETIELLDIPELAAELNRLEVRPSPSGKPRIQGSGGFHDDLAMVTATVCHDLDGVMTTTNQAIENLSMLNDDLSLGGSHTAFADVIGIPSLSIWPLDRR